MSFPLLRSPLRLFRRLTIGQKLIVCFSLTLILLAASLTTILLYVTRLNSYVDRHQHLTVPAIVTAASMQRDAFELNLALHLYLEAAHSVTASPDSESHGSIARHVAELLSRLTRSLDLYRSTHAARSHPLLFRTLTERHQVSLAEQEDRALEQIALVLQHLSSVRETGLAQQPQRTTAPRLSNADSLFAQLVEGLNQVVDAHTKIDAVMKQDGDRLLGQARLVALGLVVLLALVVTATYLLISRQVARPLRRLAATADQVAHHHLDAHFAPWDSRDEVGTLTRSLDTMLATLRERSQALERKTKELEAFTYSVAHDLKGPLREIEGFSSLLEKQFAQTQDEQLRHRIDVIRTSALRLTHMIDALLKYSRLEQASLPMARFNLLEMLGTLVAERLSGAQSLNPRIDIDLPFADLYGEPVSIRQALANLLDNAVKFARPGKSVEIIVTGTSSSTERVLCIRDRGIGFDPAYADRIFGLFERLHGAQACEGTGVGLAIVKLVMDKHGGRVWAESAPGEGAAFYLAFPNKAS